MKRFHFCKNKKKFFFFKKTSFTDIINLTNKNWSVKWLEQIKLWTGMQWKRPLGHHHSLTIFFFSLKKIICFKLHKGDIGCVFQLTDQRMRCIFDVSKKSLIHYCSFDVPVCRLHRQSFHWQMSQIKFQNVSIKKHFYPNMMINIWNRYDRQWVSYY